MPTIWLDLTDVMKWSGAVTGIERVVTGVAGAWIAANAPELAFCHFVQHDGFRALDRVNVQRHLDRFEHAPDRRRKTKLGRLLSRVTSDRGTVQSPFMRGDLLLNVGYKSYDTKFIPSIVAHLGEAGVRYAGMVHDLIPLLFPEWRKIRNQRTFETWFAFSLAQSAVVLCNSQATLRDVDSYIARHRVPRPPLVAVPLATELRIPPTSSAEARPPDMPTGPYVLCVGSIEVRKNHRLLFQVWKRLIKRLGDTATPTLALVGRKGGLTDDFLEELNNCDGFNGKILHLQKVTDAELATLYRNCLFSVYPSLYEGWGLPVAEGLAFGKYCVASNASSLPEVGGDLIDYHDPWDLQGAVALVERAIVEPAYRLQREADIAARYRPRSWRETTDAILAALPLAGSEATA